MVSALHGSLPLVGSLTTHIPALVYGTAWKKERTAHLVFQAILSGFRAFDTAAQPKHYREDLVGDAVRKAIKGGIVKRHELYVQTKFTPVSGQDINDMPYELAASIVNQVKISVASSLAHFRTVEDEPYLDCLVLHSPFQSLDDTLTAWQVFETYVPHQIRTLGISNVNLPVLEFLWKNAKIKPAVVQNRFVPESAYEGSLRAFCKAHRIVFQPFWTLKSNPMLLASRPVSQLAEKLAVSPAVAVYCLILGLENIVMLDGTTAEERMKEDLAGIQTASTWVRANTERWDGILGDFKTLVGDKS